MGVRFAPRAQPSPSCQLCKLELLPQYFPAFLEPKAHQYLFCLIYA